MHMRKKVRHFLGESFVGICTDVRKPGNKGVGEPTAEDVNP